MLRGAPCRSGTRLRGMLTAGALPPGRSSWPSALRPATSAPSRATCAASRSPPTSPHGRREDAAPHVRPRPASPWATLCAAALLTGCSVREAPRQPPARPLALPAIDFTIQAGAFGDVENAIRLAQSLEQAGIEAFHFLGDDGLHRVRFGSFPSREQAVERAEALVAGGVIAAYHVVASRPQPWGDRAGLRDEIVRAALSFLGRPYRWGGADTAFDCSGLTMTAYRLNGLGLPRSSAEQFTLGEPVPAERLREADLVFFAIEARDRATHVGLYVGDGRFVHAPGRGKLVRVDSLSDGYYGHHFLSARSYLQ